MEKCGHGGSSERRPDPPSPKPAQCGAAVFTLALAGDLFLPVKLSVEATNIKHKRRAALGGVTALFAKEGKYFSPELLKPQHAYRSPEDLVKRQILTRRPGVRPEILHF